MKSYEYELEGLTDFERVSHPLNFFPTFSESEWVDWLLIGTLPEVSNVYDLCVKYGFELKAAQTAKVLRDWHLPRIKDQRKQQRGKNLN